MEGLIDMEEENKSGKPWKIIFKSRSYEEADQERKKFLLENDQYDAKVKYLASNDCFVLKIRQFQEKNKKQG